MLKETFRFKQIGADADGLYKYLCASVSSSAFTPFNMDADGANMTVLSSKHNFCRITLKKELFNGASQCIRQCRAREVNNA